MKKIKASIIIPLKNGGDLFIKVLDSVIQQEAPWDFEILVIDSGSTDGSDNYCLQHSKVKLHRINAIEFGHGKTRNLGAKLTSGEFIVFITHDALPASKNWLFDLVSTCDQNKNIAGAFGRHLPYPDAFPIVARNLNRHFDYFKTSPSIVYLDDKDRYDKDVSYRQFLHFFSDNNACLRRSIWLTYPYPDVDFAEDQIWAKTIIEAGYAKAYSDSACVYHSHNYNEIELFRRAFDESLALNKLFEYKLCPNLKSVLKKTIIHTRDDFTFLKNTNKIRFILITKINIFVRNLLFFLGQYLGGLNKINIILKYYISLDHKLKKT